jgi:hypothetical protein
MSEDFCDVACKHTYGSKGEATKAAKRFLMRKFSRPTGHVKHGDMRAYKCECGGWHLGRQNLRKGRGKR